MFDKSALLQADEFSWDRALNCALASRLAYRDASKIRAETTGTWGFDQTEVFDAEDTQGFVTWDSDVVLVSIRGTQQLGDWLINLNVLRTERSYGKVHLGFFQGFEAARTQLSDLLQRSGTGGKKLWVTGHSLGGALATVMAAEWLNDLPVSGIYTYGQPKVVNRRGQGLFRTHYDGKYFRIVNDDDVVPKVPPLLKHVGNIIWFDENGELKEAPPGVRADEFGPEELTEEEFEEQKNIFRSLKRQINNAQDEELAMDVEEIGAAGGEEGDDELRGLLPSVRDHFMDKYIAKIRTKAAG